MIGAGTIVFLVIVFLGALLFIYLFLKWYTKGPKYQSRRRLSDQTIIITGGTSGIGRETAMNLSMRGARIILPCRDVKKGYEVAGDIKSETQGIIEVEECDLASIPSIKRFCAKVLETESRVNSLIYCAGVENTPQWTTPEGFNYQLTVNYLSQYLMTFLLLPVIKHSAPGSRIINVSCHSHREATLNLSTLFTEMENYSTRCQTALSKLCVVLHSAELGRRLDGTGVTVYCANPGPCNTKIGRYARESSGFLKSCFLSIFYRPWLRTPKNGSQTLVYCAVEESIKDHTGLYYENCAEASPSADCENIRDAQELWTLTDQALSLR